MNWTINNTKYGVYGEISEYEGKEIVLLTVDELHKIQKQFPNTILVNIFGREVLAKDANDDDRGGFSAYTTKDSIK